MSTFDQEQAEKFGLTERQVSSVFNDVYGEADWGTAAFNAGADYEKVRAMLTEYYEGFEALGIRTPLSGY